ncbi:MAG: hypothetical protein ABS81_00540 [Pseudonocardia sp. SCN 72-86]|nr:MAG: hypothetical protein ABS81_00540 [Pseudonocardia sp. SCN 72-86]
MLRDGRLLHDVDEVSRRVAELDGTAAVDVTVDAGLDWTPDMMSDRARSRRRAHLTELGIPPTPARERRTR